MAAYDFGGPGVNVTGGDHPEQVKGIHVSHEFFRLFGVPLTLGRSFTVEEDLPKGGHVVVLSNGLWQRRFGSDPNIAGMTMGLGGEPYTIIGVVGSGFTFETPVDLYLPFQADPNSVSQGHYFFAAARLKPGVGLKAAQDALKAATVQFNEHFPGLMGPGGSFSAQFMSESVVSNVRTALYILLGAVGFVLLIACANVANLQLARAAVRARELAIRAAIGAGRGRIIRQLLTESVLLALVGGVIGIALGAIGVRALLALNPGNIPRIGLDGAGVTLDWRVLVFSLALSILTGVIFGLVPAIQASRADLNLTLKETASGSGLRQNKSRAVLVIAEMALAIVLLVGAGLLIRTFTALGSVNRGFDTHNVLTMNLSLTGSKFEHSAALAEMARQAIEKVEALPGVQAAAATSYIPLQGGLGLPFVIEGRPLPAIPRCTAERNGST